MPYQPTTNFRDSNGVDLGRKLVTKDYLLEVYGTILESLGNSGLTATPALWTWGSATSGGLGDNQSSTSKSTPITTFAGGINWKQVVCGRRYSLAIKIDGTLWAWGVAGNGQLGDSQTATNKLTPITTFSGGTDWKQVSAGRAHSTAIKTDGSLWVWGANSRAQLGINNTTDRNTPVTTFAGGTNWKFVSCGGYHTIAIKTDGTLWGWGDNSGSGNDPGHWGIILKLLEVHQSLLLLVAQIGKLFWGYQHTLAVKTDGTLWSWGLNAYGQLGNLGVSTGRSILTPVTTFSGGTTWKSVNSGSSFSAAIKTDGTLWTWGGYFDFTTPVLGTNSSAFSDTPVTTFAGGTNWKSVDCGRDLMMAIKTDGTLWGWGNNTSGKLGFNDTILRSTPVTTFLGGNDWKSVACGYATAAIESVDYI